MDHHKVFVWVGDGRVCVGRGVGGIGLKPRWMDGGGGREWERDGGGKIVNSVMREKG